MAGATKWNGQLAQRNGKDGATVVIAGATVMEWDGQLAKRNGTDGATKGQWLVQPQ